MNFYCKICDKEVKTDFEKHKVCGKLIQTHTIINPKISDINKIIYDFVTNHNREYEFNTNEIILKNGFKTVYFFS